MVNMIARQQTYSWYGDVLGDDFGPQCVDCLEQLTPESRRDCVFATVYVLTGVAMQGRRKARTKTGALNKFPDNTVFEDDAIERIAKLIGCNYYEADMWRRAFAKKNEEKVMESPYSIRIKERRDSRGPQSS